MPEDSIYDDQFLNKLSMTESHMMPSEVTDKGLENWVASQLNASASHGL